MVRSRAARAMALAAVAATLTAAGSSRGETRFDEVSAATGLDFVHFNGMSGERYFAEIMGSGAALVDYDNDGDLDVYLVQGTMLGEAGGERAIFPPQGELTDRLFRNDLEVSAQGGPRARFIDVTAASGIVARGYGMGVASGDINNDGWSDLYVTNLGANQMLLNNRDGTFRDVTEATSTGDRAWGISASFFDFDLDGWLDLYLVNYTEYRIALDRECFSATGARDYCSPQAYSPEPDRLFRNRGDGTFEDVSVGSGIDAVARSGLGVATGDFDSNGWPDIYVANDQMANILWMNRGGGSFSNEAIMSGSAVNETGLSEASMGVVVADLNGDGFEDIFMSHLSRETNTLYLNDGGGFFVDESRASGLGVPSWQSTGFGIAPMDYDLDGWLDLYVANGGVKGIEELARTGDPYPLEQRDQLFRNTGGGRFEEVSARSGEVFARTEVGRGVAVGDLDLDGDPDLVVANNSGPAWHLENHGSREAARRWLSVRALARPEGRDAIGARISVVADGRARVERVSTDGSYASANAPQASFGLGTEIGGGSETSVRVDWPGGGASEWRRLPVDRHVVLYRFSGS